MTSTKHRLQGGFTLLAAAFCLCGVPAHAATFFETSLDTTGLPVLASGDHYTAYFGLTGTTGGSVTLTQLSAGNGGTLGAQGFAGDSVLHPSGAVSLKSSSFVSEFTQNFIPGDAFSFAVDLSGTRIGSPTPDTFTFAILDSTGNPLPSNDPATGFAITTIDLTKNDYAAEDFSGYSLVGSPFNTPSITEAVPPAPELSPSIAVAILAGCLVLTMGLRRRIPSASISR